MFCLGKTTDLPGGRTCLRGLVGVAMVDLSFYSHIKFICLKQLLGAAPERIMYPNLFKNTFFRVYILIVYDFVVDDL